MENGSVKVESERMKERKKKQGEGEKENFQMRFQVLKLEFLVPWNFFVKILVLIPES